MIDDVLLKAVRRYWDAEQVDSSYSTILAAYLNRTEKITVIVGKSTDGDSANAQVVISKEDYREWLATLEARLEELAAAAAGTGTTHPDVEHVVHSNRYVTT